MSNEIAAVKSFEDRMTDMMKEHAGTLFTEHELRQIAQRGLEKIFFEKKIISETWSDKKYGPALAEIMIKECLQPAMNEAIKEYIQEHQEEVKFLISDCIQKGAATMFANALNEFMRMPLMALQQQVYDLMNKR